MRTDEIETLFEYHYWTIDRLLNAASKLDHTCFKQTAEVPFGSLRALLTHTLDTDIRGRHLVQGIPGAVELHPQSFDDVHTLRDAWLAEADAMRAYLCTLDEDLLTRDFALGERRALPLWMLLTHLVFHGAQHRSEAAALITHYGSSPGDLDFYYYVITGGLGDEGKRIPT